MREEAGWEVLNQDVQGKRKRRKETQVRGEGMASTILSREKE